VILRYHHVTHNIARENVGAARHFYGDILGLKEIPATEDPTGNRLIWFAVGELQLHLVIRDKPEPASSRHIAVVVDDLEQLVDHLRRCAVRIEEREMGRYWFRRSDGSRTAFCYDPDGNRIELVEATRSANPKSKI